MDLMEMVMDKFRREGFTQGQAADQISEIYPISRATLNRFLNHAEIKNPRQLIAIAEWAGFTDREPLVEILQMYGFLPAEFPKEAEQRLTLEYRLDAIRKELEAIRRALESGENP